MLPRVEFKVFGACFIAGRPAPEISEKARRRGVVISTVVKTTRQPFYGPTYEESGLMPPQETPFLIVACEDNDEIVEVKLAHARYLDPQKEYPPPVPHKSTLYCITYQVYEGASASLPATCDITFSGSEEGRLLMVAQAHICHHYCPKGNFIILSMKLIATNGP